MEGDGEGDVEGEDEVLDFSDDEVYLLRCFGGRRDS
jgi:hypothetical protein